MTANYVPLTNHPFSKSSLPYVYNEQKSIQLINALKHFIHAIVTQSFPPTCVEKTSCRTFWVAILTLDSIWAMEAKV